MGCLSHHGLLYHHTPGPVLFSPNNRTLVWLPLCCQSHGGWEFPHPTWKAFSGFTYPQKCDTSVYLSYDCLSVTVFPVYLHFLWWRAGTQWSHDIIRRGNGSQGVTQAWQSLVTGVDEVPSLMMYVGNPSTPQLSVVTPLGETLPSISPSCRVCSSVVTEHRLMGYL